MENKTVLQFIPVIDWGFFFWFNNIENFYKNKNNFMICVSYKFKIIFFLSFSLLKNNKLSIFVVVVSFREEIGGGRGGGRGKS